jgi:hypothetical protein
LDRGYWRDHPRSELKFSNFCRSWKIDKRIWNNLNFREWRSFPFLCHHHAF